MRLAVAWCSLLCAGGLTWGMGMAGETQAVGTDGNAGGQRMGLFFKPHPLVLTVADLPDTIDSATVTDVQVADFDGDGRKDIAVAWYATDNEDPLASQRALSIYLCTGGPVFAPPITFNLYNYDPVTPGLSIFRKGTSAIGVGDFDGDGDLDLAVLPFFGDELWFIENLGGGTFAQHLAFMFGINEGMLLTPPVALSADFDGDGRDELVYLVDPILYPDDQPLHFWKTDGAIADMYRLDWEGFGDTLPMQWTRALTIADFDGDGHPDLCFTRARNAPQEDGPVFTVWHGLDQATGLFQVWNELPNVLWSDVAAVRPDPNCRPGVVLTDLNGTLMQYWANECSGPMDFHLGAQVTGYAGVSYNRGMAAALGDVDGDGDQDLVTKQKLGQASQSNQIEITLCSNAGTVWRRVNPTPIDTTGFQNQQSNAILRPRNLAVADLFGNSLPEIIAGFSMSEHKLKVAIWPNGCVADVNRDGTTGFGDLLALWAAWGTCRGGSAFNPDADLDKSGCVGSADMELLVHDYECLCWTGPGHVLADMNCDGDLSYADVSPFIMAVTNRTAYEATYPSCHWIYGDVNEDGSVDFNDINPLVHVFSTLYGPPDAP